MKYRYSTLLLVLILLFQSCAMFHKSGQGRTSVLDFEQITPATFVHKSYLQTKTWGKVSCNGLVYIADGEAIVFDTPVDDSAARELIRWVTEKKKATIKAVVVNHFHADCLGGLSAFHAAGIPSYSSELTQKLAAADTVNKPEVPQNGFHVRLILKVGSKEVVNKYLGEAHTRDNIVSYVPSEKVLFGGCMIKELKAGKGYLGDANEQEWSNTVVRVTTEFKDARYVVPGHGQYGDTSLLSYTYRLFLQ
jgi:metallo-beta-lactamase class B